jgi:hypothetical protein
MASASIRFRDVRSHGEGRQIDEHLIAVVPLVGHDLADDGRLSIRRDRDGFEFLGRRSDGLGNRRGITLIGALHGHTHDGTGLHVDGVLRLVCQMRAAVLHLRDARVWVVWMPPVFVAALLRAPAIQLCQIRSRGRFDARRLGERVRNS